MANLKLKPSKCFCGYDQVKYLGHIVSKDGVALDPEKIRAVERFLVPTTRRSVRGFLGLAGYYRRFIVNFSKVARTLSMLTSPRVPFEWTNWCQEAFEQLKVALISASVLVMYDPCQPLTLHMDASTLWLGAVLYHGEGKERQVLAYSSRTLLPVETRYPIMELEALAVV